MSARASTTTKKYERGWSKWLEWCKDKDEVKSVPANPFFVAILHKLRLEERKQQSALVAAFYGIRWGHHINGVESPTDHPFVCMAFDGAVRLCEKKPKTPNIICFTKSKKRKKKELCISYILQQTFFSTLVSILFTPANTKCSMK